MELWYHREKGSNQPTCDSQYKSQNRHDDVSASLRSLCCRPVQDLGPLLVSICTPDLKRGFAVTRLSSGGLWRRRQERMQCQETLAHSDSLQPPQTCAAFSLMENKIRRYQAFKSVSSWGSCFRPLCQTDHLTQSVFYSAPLSFSRLGG